MGNNITKSNFEDPPLSLSDCMSVSKFFADLDIEAIEFFFDRLEFMTKAKCRFHSTKAKTSPLSQLMSSVHHEENDDAEHNLTWQHYFQICTQLKENQIAEKEKRMRMQWHVATRGFVMEKAPPPVEEPEEEEEPPIIEEKGIPDDFTEDEASELGDDEHGNDDSKENDKKADDEKKVDSKQSDGEESGEKSEDELKNENAEAENEESENKRDKKDDEANNIDDAAGDQADRDKEEESDSEKKVVKTAPKISKKPVKRRWNDSSYISPIFFGYTTKTVKDLELQRKAELDEIKETETRAVDAARRLREAEIETLEKALTTQASSREKKIEELKSKMEAQQERRVKELEKNQRNLNEQAFKMYKNQWEKDNTAASLAAEEELRSLEEVHKKKTESDSSQLRHQSEALEAFKDAEKQQLPAAEKLEAIARLEIDRFIEEVMSQQKKLEKVRKEYHAVVAELTSKTVNGVSKANQKQVMELRSMVNIAETRVKVEQKALESSLQRLLDAEVLMKRALRIKHQQSEILPLFKLLAIGGNTNQLRSGQSAKDIEKVENLMSQTHQNSAHDVVKDDSKAKSGHHSNKSGHSQRSHKHSHKSKKKGNTSTLGHNIDDDDISMCSHVRLDLFTSAITFIMNATFEQKFNFFIRRFQNEISSFAGFSSPLFFDMKFLFKSMFLCQESLYIMKFYALRPNAEDIYNTIWRFFKEMKLPANDVKTDFLTEFECKHFLKMYASKSQLITQILRIPPRDEWVHFGTYQRNSMAPIALYQRALITSQTCKYRLHYESTRFHACLNPKNKQSIHERAMFMGEDDPLKPDYTPFIMSPEKKVNTYVIPLTHGHCVNSKFTEDEIRNKSAILIQATYRSFYARKLAELHAKYQAFMEAKTMAMKEMRMKVVKEYKKREQSSGMGKMKWDAQVRMKQAKLRSTGQAVSRSDVVLIMMEEAIDNASKEIEKKFQVLQEKEDFAGIDFDKKFGNKNKNETETVEEAVDIVAMFGMILKPKVEDTSVLLENVATPREKLVKGDENGNDNEENKGETEGVEESKGENAKQKKKEGDDFQALKPEITRAIIEGSYTRHNKLVRKTLLNNCGESEALRNLRYIMECAEPSPKHFFSRLLSLNNVVTIYKLTNFLLEIPSKHLLIKYVQNLSKEDLTRELKFHFRFMRNPEVLTTMFRNFAISDNESGELMKQFKEIQNQLEIGIIMRVKSEMLKNINEMQTMITRRLETNETLNHESVVQEEISRMESFTNKFKNYLVSLAKESSQLQEKYRRTLLSFYEMSRKLQCLMYIKSETVEKVPYEISIGFHERNNWCRRLKFAMNLPEHTTALKRVKYSEMRNVCREFLNVIEWDAMVLINEHQLPSFQKTIPVAQKFVVHGRAEVCGRGVCNGFDNGSYFVYEAHNVMYFVVEDYNGICNGVDEFAMKIAGKERLSSLEYFKLHINGLNVPLMATLDFNGYRVLCTAKLPQERIVFSDEGEVRKISEDLVHGVSKDGDNFVNKSKILQTLLKSAALKLNLVEHHVRGLKDITSQTTHASSELKAYKAYLPSHGDMDMEALANGSSLEATPGSNSVTTAETDHEDEDNEDANAGKSRNSHASGGAEFYLKDFWRTFPSETPRQTPHLTPVPREQSVFWRQLRPELVRTFARPLNPDVHTLMSFHQKDYEKHYEDISTATSYLVTEIIPEFAEFLSNRDYHLPQSEGLGIDFDKDLHSRGINIRHLGLIRSLLWRKLPGTFSLYFNEQFIRSAKDLREEIQAGEIIRIVDRLYTITENKQLKITHKEIPINEKYFGLSSNNLEAHAGTISTDKNADALRSVILAEMVARTLKNIIRFKMRSYVKKFKAISFQFISGIVADHLNLITGAHAESRDFYEEALFENIRERFGSCAIRKSERTHFFHIITPCIAYIVKRLQQFLGIQITVSSLSEFQDRPVTFNFVAQDFLKIAPVIKHNIPIMAFADAVLVTLNAVEAESKTFDHQILRDDPVLYFRLSERKGCREMENKGRLGKTRQRRAQSGKKPGKVVTGYYSPGCELECSGPISGDQFTRSVGFNPALKSYAESKFHKDIVPTDLYKHFSVECFVRTTGSPDTIRSVLMCGRFQLIVTRENLYTFVFMHENYEANIRVIECELNIWYHMVFTFDGTTLKGYVNGIEAVSVEIEPLIQKQMDDFEEEFSEKLEEINAEEKSERTSIKEKTHFECDKYFQSKEGIFAMKKLSQNIMESRDFQAMNIGVDAKDEVASMKMKKTEALKQAKTQYMTESYIKNVKSVTEKYKVMRDDLTDFKAKLREQGVIRSQRGLRLGSVATATSLKEGTHFFHGQVSCVAIFNKCLSKDRIKDHNISANMIQPKRINDKSTSLNNENDNGSNAMLSDKITLTCFKKDVQRFHAIASSRFEEALLTSCEDILILRNYAKSLCDYLKNESLENAINNHNSSQNLSTSIFDEIEAEKSQSNAVLASLSKDKGKDDTATTSLSSTTQGKLKVLHAMQEFTWRRVPQGIAEIMLQLPRDMEYGDLFAIGFESILRIDRNFFAANSSDEPYVPPKKDEEPAKSTHLELNRDAIQTMSRRDLIPVPNQFLFDDYHASQDRIRIGANIYREISRDSKLGFAFGEQNLNFLHQIKSNEMIISLVRHVKEDKQLSIVKLGEMFANAGRKSINIEDGDIEILVHNVPNLRGLVLSNCRLLSNDCVAVICRIKSIRVINLDNVPKITDAALKHLYVLNDTLEVFSISGNGNVTEAGLIPLFQKCYNLTHVNLSYCSQVTDEILLTLVSNNQRIKNLNLAGLQNLTDDGLSLICTKLVKPIFHSLDISYCRAITDFGIISVCESVTNLQYLNVCGVNRISDIGVRYICSKLWYLRYLNCEDLYLINDSPFFFSITFDGRMAADENMLKSLVFLSLKDCVHLTDEGIRGLAERCRKIETFILCGCDKITNKGMAHLAEKFEENIPLCDGVKSMDLSYCCNVNVDGLKALLPACGILEELALNGYSSIDDTFTQFLCKKCNTVQRLSLQHCIFVTDISLCHFADYLWIEKLDISGCYKVTDYGIEVLVIACNGLLSLSVAGVHKLTDSTVYAVSRNCKLIQSVNVDKCDKITVRSLKVLRANHNYVEIKSNFPEFAEEKIEGAAANDGIVTGKTSGKNTQVKPGTEGNSTSLTSATLGKLNSNTSGESRAARHTHNRHNSKGCVNSMSFLREPLIPADSQAGESVSSPLFSANAENQARQSNQSNVDSNDGSQAEARGSVRNTIPDRDSTEGEWKDGSQAEARGSVRNTISGQESQSRATMSIISNNERQSNQSNGDWKDGSQAEVRGSVRNTISGRDSTVGERKDDSQNEARGSVRNTKFGQESQSRATMSIISSSEWETSKSGPNSDLSAGEIPSGQTKSISRASEYRSSRATKDKITLENGEVVEYVEYNTNDSAKHSSWVKDFAGKYDLCMVLPTEEDGTLSKKSTGYINTMRKNGLDLFVYYSMKKKEAIVLIRLSLENLRAYADKINFMMLLDKDCVKKVLEAGNPSKHIAPVNIAHMPEICSYEPHEHIYSKYSRLVGESIFWRPEGKAHPFRDLTRLKLTAMLVEARPPSGGEPLKLRRYLRMGSVLGYFPLHDRSKTEMLEQVWMDYKLMPWKAPFDEIKEYYGEKITLYFCFMGHYTKWLMFPAIVGLPIQLAVFIVDDFSLVVLPYFAFIIAIWAIVMLEFWKREEQRVALKWGTSLYEDMEQDRPDFKGKSIPSYIDGSPIKHFPTKDRNFMLGQSSLVILTMIGMVIGVVVSIYIIRATLNPSYAQTVASILNAVQIQVTNAIYSFVAKALTDRENHRTDTHYEDSMIIKLFWFQFVNSYASFFYLAFIEGNMPSLAMNLGIIFGSRLISGNIAELLIPYLSYQFKYIAEVAKGKMSRPEKEFLLTPYDVMTSSLEDYAEIAIQFGYNGLFLSALPMASFFGLISNFVEVKGDAWKLLNLFQRPVPTGAQDIGMWQTIFLMLTAASVITNAGLAVFTMTTFDQYSYVVKLWIFIIFQWACFTLQFVVMSVIPDVPEEIEIQASRREFIVSKVIDHIEDDIEEDVHVHNDGVVFQDYPDDGGTYDGTHHNLLFKNMK